MKTIRVAILMGSDSDLPVMQKATETLDKFKVAHRMTVASAHRSPEYVREFISQAEKDGAQVFITGAGGAAHLAGAVAAITTKPVIGVPLGSKLSGFDSLLSTVQMPKGVPVATVAIDNAANAGILAVQILAVADHALVKRLVEYKQQMERDVLKKADSIAGTRNS